MTLAQEFKNLFFKAYSQLNYEQFCEIIQEQPTRNGQPNEYALNKWQHFQIAASSLGSLGIYVDEIIESQVQSNLDSTGHYSQSD